MVLKVFFHEANVAVKLAPGCRWQGPIVLDLCHRLCRRSKLGIVAGLCGTCQRNTQQQSKDLHFHDNLPFRRYPGKEI